MLRHSCELWICFSRHLHLSYNLNKWINLKVWRAHSTATRPTASNQRTSQAKIPASLPPKRQPSQQLPLHIKQWSPKTCWPMKRDLKATVTLNGTVQNRPLTLIFRFSWTKELMKYSQMKRRTTKCQSMRMRMRTESTNWSTLKIWRNRASECLAPSRASNKGTLTHANLKNS